MLSEAQELEVADWVRDHVQIYNNGITKEEEKSGSEDELIETRRLVTQQNRKKKKSGGFQVMGLSYAISKGISRKGYKIPTPIQRKTIPLIIDGKDIVAMARTGSGKTAAFLIPMFERLITHSSKGVRAIIMSPTRELAMQTLKFTKELGRFAGLKAAVILGGDRMDDQFAAVHENPDIIIATPGRFLHVTMEMDLKLKSVEYVVFDEADRLFEMGFQEQLNEILHRLPESRQTLLFSATLPKLLVEFAKAGLTDPTLIRLDVDSKLSDQLKMSFLSCRPSDKPALLLHLLQNVIKDSDQTVIFAATKHHVEFLNLLLEKAGIVCSYIYSSCDQTARKISIAKFQHRKVNVMIVTDLAARGIDIPLLDNVINYNFPAKAKLFVHRVGRVARAGRSGTAYSLVCSEEVPYLFDLHVFLGRAVNLVPLENNNMEDQDGLYGLAPQNDIDDVAENIRQWMGESIDLQNLQKVSENAYKNYVRSRPAPAPESVKRMKEMEKDGVKLGTHPVFGKSEEDERTKLLNALRGYKANTTIFEVNSTAKNKSFDIMKGKRNFHGNVISWNQKRIEIKQKLEQQEVKKPTEQMSANDDDLQDAFSSIVAPGSKLQRKKKPVTIRDEENYLPYKPKDFQSELGLSITKSFERDASGAVLDLTGDEVEDLRRQQHHSRW
ncbi:ATP-dependent RNA helicase DDX54-like [Gigantopelta aegis]|uniref:ATP-dependent RNA helicase DDX54-like n=1 Tax=Gigantopelta aegis TaxID=1735272 RepID=UPI001B889E54|nr:ATP-dependent RNA helicase DDX54-like [Gigantopelta aegis]